MSRRRIGLALGSGSARGWAHIGVLRALEARGIEPDVVCGTSIGALVGAAWAAGRLDDLEAWVRRLTRRDVMGFLDVSFSGGLFAARRLFDYFARNFEDVDIEALRRPFAAVATDLVTGQEIWLRSGPVLRAVRASISVPGLFTPVWHDDRWLVDGGLVNPVPVSVCRALQADVVIAVDLQAVLLGQDLLLDAPAARVPAPPPPPDVDAEAREAVPETPGVQPAVEALDPAESEAGESPGLWRRVQERARELMTRAHPEEAEPDAPSIFEVTAKSLDVMQVRISRSRMAGDPPDLLVTPRLPDVGLLDYHRAEEAIEEGRRATERALALYETAVAART